MRQAQDKVQDLGGNAQNECDARNEAVSSRPDSLICYLPPRDTPPARDSYSSWDNEQKAEADGTDFLSRMQPSNEWRG